MKAIHNLTTLPVIVGGLNWGLFGFAGFDLAAALFRNATLSRFIYSLVGISAVLPQQRTAIACS